jgi:hypothetical protein
VVAACVSVVTLVAGTVFLAATSDESSSFGLGLSLDDESSDDDAPAFEDNFDDEPEIDDEPFDYGDDEELDLLYEECEAGDMVACDDLYYDSPPRSAYEDFGSTCGERGGHLFGECAAELDDEDAEEPDADLDSLRASCAEGDMEACDDLYFDSPVGSDEEEFGSTCGGRQDPTNGDCA